MLKRFSLLALFAVFLLMGAGGDSISHLDGTWRCNIRESAVYMGVAPNDPSIDMMVQMLGVLEQITMTLDSRAATITMSDNDNPPDTYKYTLLSTEDGVYKLDTQEEGVFTLIETEDTSGELALAFSEGGNKDESLVFVREK